MAGDLCNYDQPDTTAVLTDTYDRAAPGLWVPNTWYSRCHCGTVTCESGSYAEAMDALEQHRGAVMATSLNGWPASGDRRAIDVALFAVQGVEFPGGVKTGDVATVLEYVVNRFRLEVEPLVPGWCWGWNHRPVTGGGRLSNHASGTAVDVNAPHHPYGKRDTFTARQRGTIRAIIGFCEGVVRWGGDYQSTPDDMHFEINKGPADVARVAAKIHAATRPIQPPEEADVANVELVHGDSKLRTPNGKWAWGDLVYLVEYSPTYPGGAGRRYVYGKIATRMMRKLGNPTEWPQSELDAVHTVLGGEVPTEVYQ